VFPAACEIKGVPTPSIPMRWLGVPILLLMNWVYKYVGNYGLAIILLTVVNARALLPADREEHAVDEGDAGAATSSKRASATSTRATRSGCRRRRSSSTGNTR